MITALIGALKASLAIGLVRAVGQVALTFLPLVLIKNRIARKYIEHLGRVRDSHLRKRLFCYEGYTRARYLFAC